MLRTTMKRALAVALAVSMAVPAPLAASAASQPAPARSQPAYASFKPAGPAGFARPSAAPKALNVRWRAGVPKSQIDGAAARLGLRVVRTSKLGWTQVLCPSGVSPQQLSAKLRQLGLVSAASPAVTMQAASTFPNDPGFTGQWGLHNTGQPGIETPVGTPDDDIDAPEAWDIERGSKSVVVAVVDTGINWRHPDLRPNIWTNTGEVPNNYIDDDGNGYEDDVHGFDFYNYDGTVYDAVDGDQHATHVAGTIGAESDNATGVAGVAWDVTIMPVKFLGPFGGDDFSGAEAIVYAVDNGADVINCSWGGYGTSEILEEAIAYANDAGVLMCVAAGNESSDVDIEPYFPAQSDSPNVLTIAATDRNDELAWFSNYGASTVDLAAPGDEITSTLPWESSAVYVNAPPYKIAYLPFQAERLEPAAQRDAIIARAVGRVGASASTPILVVDDSAAALTGESAGERLAVYTDALDVAGYTDIEEWVTEDQGAPTAAAMRGRVVVWFTGKQSWGWYPDPIMSQAEMDGLAAYLDNGGRLVMVSGELASDAEYFGNGWEWFETYFRCMLVDLTTWSSTIRGKSGTPFYGLNASIPAEFSVYDEDAKLWPTGSDAIVPLDVMNVSTQMQVGGYGPLSGTSMATPHVSGVAALLKSEYPAANVAELTARLANTVDPVPALDGRTVFAGRLNAANAFGGFVGRPTVLQPKPGDRWQAGTPQKVRFTVPPQALQNTGHEVEYGLPYEAWAEGFEDGDTAGWEGIEVNGSLPWEVTSDPDWVHGGTYAARSGTLGTGVDLGDGWVECSGSSLATTLTVPDGGATLSLWWKYSGGADTFADLWVDGVNLGWEFESFDWKRATCELAPGDHRLSVSAVNCSLNLAPDAGVAIDDLTLTAHDFTPLPVAAPGAREVSFTVPAVDTDDLWVRVRGVDGPKASAWAYAKGVRVSTDLSAPSPVTALDVTATGDGMAAAAWVNPADVDFDFTRVLYRTDRFPTGPSDTAATVVAEGTDVAATLGPEVDGKTVYVAAYASDLAGNWSTTATDTALIEDETAPDPVSLLDAQLYDGVVTLSWMAPDPALYQDITVLRRTDATPSVGDPAAELVFRDRGALASDWTLDPAATKAYYTVYAKDPSGNVSDPRSIAVDIDLEPPTGEIIVAGGWSHIDTATVSVVNEVTGATEMRLFANGEIDDDAPWVPFSVCATMALSPIDGPQTVLGQFRDAAGNMAEIVGEVYVDLLAPEPPFGVSVQNWNSGARVAWPHVDDPTIAAFRVFVAPSASGPWTAANGPDGTPCVGDAFYVGGLTAGARRYFSVSAIDMFGREGARSEPVSTIPGVGVVRRAGADRYATAVEISKAHFDAAESVMIVGGNAPADALGAATYAGVGGMPVLLTEPSKLSTVTAAEIERLGATSVIIVGGDRSVSPAVAEALSDAGLAVTRFGGANRFAVAAELADQTTMALGTEWDGTVLVANGNALTDALSAAPLAFASKTPILLVTDTGVPAETAAFVRGGPTISHALALGGMKTLPEPVVTQVCPSWQRLGGTNRYATARAIAEYTVAHGFGSWQLVGIAGDRAVTDALAAGPALGADGGVLLLTAATSLPPETQDALTDNARGIGLAEVYGGPASVSVPVVTAIERTLKSTSGDLP